MEYLETRKLVHRDLAAGNVLVNDEGTAKVSDFGLANKSDHNHVQAGRKFHIRWTAPEALRDNPLADVMFHVERGYGIGAPEGCPPEIYTVMADAWNADPKQRPTF